MKILIKYLNDSINLIKEIIKNDDDFSKKELIKKIVKYNKFIIDNELPKILLLYKSFDRDDIYDKRDKDIMIDYYFNDLSILEELLENINLLKDKISNNFFKEIRELQKKYDNIDKKNNISFIIKYMMKKYISIDNNDINNISNYINCDNDKNIMLTIKYFTKRREFINTKPMIINHSRNKKIVIKLIKKYLHIMNLDKVIRYNYYERRYDERERTYKNDLHTVKYDLDDHISKLDLNKILKTININEDTDVFKNNKPYFYSKL